MTTDLVVRPAAAGAWERIWPFWHDVVARGDTYCYEPTTSQASARAGWFDNPRADLAVAELDGRVVGAGIVLPNQTGAGSHIANGSYMVEESVRGRGVGRALVVDSLERCRRLGYRGLQFNAVAATNAGAIRLYESLGFVTLGRVPGGFAHPRAGYVDLLIMFHDLG